MPPRLERDRLQPAGEPLESPRLLVDGQREVRQAIGVTVALGFIRRTDLSDRVLLNVGRLVTVLLVIVAVFLMVDGIRDV